MAEYESETRLNNKMVSLIDQRITFSFRTIVSFEIYLTSFIKKNTIFIMVLEHILLLDDDQDYLRNLNLQKTNIRENSG